MTEREYERVSENPATGRREVYRQVETDSASAPIASDAAHEVVQQRVSGPAGERVVRSERVSEPSETARRASTVTRAKQVIYFIFGAINILLIIRFVLLALGANQASGFVQLIYSLSQPLVAPFFGIFGEPTFGSSVLEWASLVAIIIYSLVGWGLARLMELLYAPARPTALP